MKDKTDVIEAPVLEPESADQLSVSTDQTSADQQPAVPENSFAMNSTAENSPARRTPTEAPPPEKSLLAKSLNLVGGLALIGLLVWLGAFVSLTALIVVLGLIFMIFLHEMGHFLTARATGMKASEFFLGFGPRLWSFKKGETEYGVRLLPLGAYVRIAGMTNLEDIDPAEENRTYRAKSYPRKLLVAVAGSGMHFLLALGVLWALFGAIGYYSISTNSDEVFDSWQIQRVATDGPAEAAGFMPGDRITGVRVPPSSQDVMALDDFDATRDFISTNPGQRVGFEVERDGELQQLTATIAEVLPADAASPDQTVGRLGFFSQQIDTTGPPTNGLIGGFGSSVVEFGKLTKLLAEDFVRVFSFTGLSNLADNVFDTGPDEPTANNTTGVSTDDSRIVSIYGVGRLATDLGENGDWALLLFLFAVINIFIGLFNLIPLPPFDGGHVAVATYERARSFRGRSYRIDASKLVIVQYAVILVFLVIGGAAFYLDLVDPIGVN